MCMVSILSVCMFAPFTILNSQVLSQESLFSKSGFWPIDTAMDSEHNHYAIGSFWGTVVFGKDTLASDGLLDVFIVKYGHDGKLLWAIKEGGRKNDAGFGLCVDSLGNVYATGYFSDTASFGSVSLVGDKEYDVFVAKYDSSGNLLWANRQGGPCFDAGYDIVCDEFGDVYVTGFLSDTLAESGTSFLGTGNRDVFVSKYDKNGTLLWTTRGGGAKDDYGHTISVDSTGNIVVEGFFTDQAVFDGETIDGRFPGPNSFYSVYNSSGNKKSVICK